MLQDSPPSYAIAIAISTRGAAQAGGGYRSLPHRTAAETDHGRNDLPRAVPLHRQRGALVAFAHRTWQQ
jgi:hypothetical protein